MKKLKTFIEKFHPEIIEEFNRFNKGFDQLKPGMKLRMLRSGFGGWPGVIREVVEISVDRFGKYALLKEVNSRNNLNYLLYEKTSKNATDDHWFKAFEVIDEGTEKKT